MLNLGNEGPERGVINHLFSFLGCLFGSLILMYIVLSLVANTRSEVFNHLVVESFTLKT